MKLSEIKKLLKEFKSVPTGDEFLDKLFQLENHSRDYYRFFYQLVHKYSFKNIVELGGCDGTSAAYLASAGSKVITIDHHTDPFDELNVTRMETAVRNFPNIKYCKGWTCTEIFLQEHDKHSKPGENAFPKVLEHLNGEKIDLLFIDSWHNDVQAFKDWNAYTPLLNKGALVICDDIDQGSPGGGIYNMKEGFWDKLYHEKHLDKSLMYYPIGFLIYDS